jgi:hypothetical protein
MEGLKITPKESGQEPEAEPKVEAPSQQERDMTRRGFFKTLLGAGAIAAGLGSREVEASDNCGAGSTVDTYMGRSYCSPIIRGPEPKLTPENMRIWSEQHDCLSNYVNTGSLKGKTTCTRGAPELEKYLAGNGKLTNEGCAYFQWLDRRWDRAYRKGMPGVPVPPWRNGNLPERYTHIKN